MSIANTFQPSDKLQAFVENVAKGKYDRQITAGISKFVDNKVDAEMQDFYSPDELKSLIDLNGTDREIERRMPVKITRHYFEQAKNSTSLQQLIKASPDETFDMTGSQDPGKQMDYSPVEGLLHKYEIGLIYVASTCSAHCRFCYREELIARKQITRSDGTTAPKGLAQVDTICSYIRQFNAAVEANGGLHPDCGREKLREILMLSLIHI